MTPSNEKAAGGGAVELQTVAHLVEKGRAFVDRPFLTELAARKSLGERGDGAFINELVRRTDAESALKLQADRIAELEKDAARYRWLADRFVGADFAWGGDDDGNPGAQMLLIRWPGGSVWGDLTMTIDAALSKTA